MCLTTVDKNPKCKSGRGYKLLYADYADRIKTGIVLTGVIHHEVQVGVPVIDSSIGTVVLFGSKPQSYPKGFHIFKSKKGMANFQKAYCWYSEKVIVAAVKYRNVVATGSQRSRKGIPGSNVVVVREFTATKIIQRGGLIKL